MELRVTVLDVNDNTPVFGRPSYAASVRENVPAGESIARVCMLVRVCGGVGWMWGCRVDVGVVRVCGGVGWMWG